MTNHIRRSASVAVTVVLLIALGGCGSRLSYSKVLAENAALGATTNNGQATVGNTASTGSATGGSTTGTTSPSGSGVATGSGPQGSSPGGGTASSGPGSGDTLSSGQHASNSPATGSVVNVGQLGTDSGLVGTLLGGERSGAEIWAAYVNQHGGLNGHRVNLVTADDGGDPSTGLAEIQTMVQQDHIIALVASDDALSEPAIAPYLDSVHVPDIGGDDVVTEWYSNPMFFPNSSSSRIGLDGEIQAVVAKGDTKIATVYCVEFALACSDANSVIINDAPSLGARVVYSSAASLAQPDFTSDCLAAKQAGATAFLVQMDPNSILRLTSDCADQGYHPQYCFFGLVFVSSLLSPNTIGAVGASTLFPYPVVAPQTLDFDTAVREATGAAPTTEAEAIAWVAGLVLETASADLPASAPSAANVLSGLYKIKDDTFGGLTAPMSYFSGQPTTSPTCYWLMAVGRSGLEASDGLVPHCLPSQYSPDTS